MIIEISVLLGQVEFLVWPVAAPGSIRIAECPLKSIVRAL